MKRLKSNSRNSSNNSDNDSSSSKMGKCSENSKWTKLKDDVVLSTTVNFMSGLAQIGGGFGRIGLDIATKSADLAFTTAKGVTSFGLGVTKSAMAQAGLDTSLVDSAEYLALLGISMGEAATLISLSGSLKLVKGLQQLFGDSELLQMAIGCVQLISTHIAKAGIEMGIFDSWKYFSAWVALQNITKESWAEEHIFPFVTPKMSNNTVFKIKLSSSEKDIRRNAPLAKASQLELLKHFSPFAIACYGQDALRVLNGEYSVNYFHHSKTYESKKNFYSEFCGIPVEQVSFMSAIDNKKDIFEVGYLPNFVVSVDESTRNVVLAFRGTLSIRDAVIDLTCEPSSLELAGQEFLVHDGMKKIALKMTEYSSKVWQEVKYMLDLNPNYGLVITGHSLGAAIASLLGVLWGDLETCRIKYSSGLPERPITVYAYACPSIFDMNLCEKTSNIIKTCTIGDDCLARISLKNVVEILDAMLWLRQESKNNEELIPSILEAAYGIQTTIFDSSESLYSSQMAKFLKVRCSIAAEHFKAENKLFCPGTIYWITRKTNDQPYILYRVLRREKVFGEVYINSQSLDDHMPIRFESILIDI
jgi:hypothetical protein